MWRGEMHPINNTRKLQLRFVRDAALPSVTVWGDTFQVLLLALVYFGTRLNFRELIDQIISRHVPFQFAQNRECSQPADGQSERAAQKRKIRRKIEERCQLCRQDQSASAPAELHMSFPNRWSRNRWNFQKFTSHAQHRMFYTPVLSLFSATVVSER